jgi:2-polyprenyl-3-methyl-5-hydroxy-6-metoxy-1,4-benzoquinol methylase
MTAGDAARWDTRYRDREAATAAKAPDALIASGFVDLIPTVGRALDVACGVGAQALWLALRGLDVEAIDVSTEAVRRVTDRASVLGLDRRINASRLDLDDGIPQSFGHFEVIVCQRFRSPDLYAAIVDRLAPGGIAIVTVLSQTGVDDPGPFHAPHGELAAAFDRPAVEALFHSAADGEESIILRATS